MSSRYTSAVLGSSPWSGPRTGEGLGGYGPDPVKTKYHGAERLAELRARPPFGSPFHPTSPA